MPIKPPTHKRKAPGRVTGHKYNRQRYRTFHTGSKTWRAIRRRILLRDELICRDCGGYGDQVDHDDGDSTNNDDDNLVTRCIRCHSEKTARETLNQ